ncbi:hypothetical protein WJX84_009544 [Apatococcus fuscideae]|uniref:HIRAN domain-containing protein n=1 Tax=Apatococcus fuscideae TaxID=2026836 RepID=A0AAW1RE17_9CHLO
MELGRQVWISKLEAEQPVEFRHEPDNPYDSNAVKILTLGGTHLGYVPRTETAHFKFPITFGWVSSLGPAAAQGFSEFRSGPSQHCLH